MVDLGGWRGGLQGVTSLTGVHYVARLRGDFREQRGVDRSAQLDPVSLCLSPQASQILRETKKKREGEGKRMRIKTRDTVALLMLAVV